MQKIINLFFTFLKLEREKKCILSIPHLHQNLISGFFISIVPQLPLDFTSFSEQSGNKSSFEMHF